MPVRHASNLAKKGFIGEPQVRENQTKYPLPVTHQNERTETVTIPTFFEHAPYRPAKSMTRIHLA